MEKPLVQTLTQVLRDNASDSKREAALAPLLDAYHEPLIRLARQKLRQSNRPLGLEMEDLVQDAWMQLILRLQKTDAPPIQDDHHAFAFLRRVVLTKFLDAIDKQPAVPVYELDAPFDESDTSSQTGGDRLISSESTRAEGTLFFAHEGVREQLLHALFESEDAFRDACKQPPRRRARQYQAMVLYYLVQMIADMADPQDRPVLFNKMSDLIGVPKGMQEKLIGVLVSEELKESEILSIINALCETKIENSQNFGKMRYEINQLL
jgi:DNA-directed RNA polymerase specialized sigma24 family protein